MYVKAPNPTEILKGLNRDHYFLTEAKKILEGRLVREAGLESYVQGYIDNREVRCKILLGNGPFKDIQSFHCVLHHKMFSLIISLNGSIVHT